ncbi:hypothetical protein [Hymenobacter metallilatus]|uniref:Uncharacterized protein n=1 Tax=Hymenobacter metallilatus TaxID=2493666 RepID=A0A3R9N659_9BACT|nr:hypothetical protein [Hymenobacter metallilatus]RSK24201.1 hypothetical protein EI290_20690 [Hymenobacter metallilatus]
MAQSTDSALSQFTALATNALSILLGVSSGVVTSTTQSPVIGIAESLGTIYYAVLGGAASYCVKLLLDAGIRKLRSRWATRRAAAVPAPAPVLVSSSELLAS